MLLRRIEQPKHQERCDRKQRCKREELIRRCNPDGHSYPEADRRRESAHLNGALYNRARANEPDPAHQSLEDTGLRLNVIVEREMTNFEICARAHGEQRIGAEPRPARVASLQTYQSWLRMKKSFAVYYFEVNSGDQTMHFLPTDYSDITAVAEQKKKVLYAHKSQDPDDIYLNYHFPMQLFRGREIRVKEAEAFVRLDSKESSLLSL